MNAYRVIWRFVLQENSDGPGDPSCDADCRTIPNQAAGAVRYNPILADVGPRVRCGLDELARGLRGSRCGVKLPGREASASAKSVRIPQRQ